jgi:hypothetical protein
MDRMIIGVDPHKASVTIEVVDRYGTLAATGRFPTARGGYEALMKYVRQWPQRVWAVEGSGGAGPPLAQRLVGDGEKPKGQLLRVTPITMITSEHRMIPSIGSKPGQHLVASARSTRDRRLSSLSDPTRRCARVSQFCSPTTTRRAGRRHAAGPPGSGR